MLIGTLLSIKSVHINNFRGIADPVDVEIGTVTIFVGPNSSGKSSCLHALACLSQTVKVVADDRPIVLDHESASVHLGRFIEVIHSKSYQDQISLGVCLDDVRVFEFFEDPDSEESNRRLTSKIVNEDVTAVYNFKCSKRTQEVALESFDIRTTKPVLSGRKLGSQYSLTTRTGKKLQIPVKHLVNSGFLLEGSALAMSLNEQGAHPADSFLVQSIQSEIQSELNRTLYLGPFRQPPARRYASRGAAPSEVGPYGDSTITMLANEAVQSRSRPHLTQIAGWLSHMKLAKALEVSRIGSSDLFNANLTLADGKKFPLADLGYGLSQVLPVLTPCSFAPHGATLLFEQPELHVHPLATKGLSKAFIDTVKEKRARICLETHSPELVRSFFNAVKRKLLRPDELFIYSVRRTNGRTELTRVDVDDYGENYENWERDLSFQ